MAWPSCHEALAQDSGSGPKHSPPQGRHHSNLLNGIDPCTATLHIWCLAALLQSDSEQPPNQQLMHPFMNTVVAKTYNSICPPPSLFNHWQTRASGYAFPNPAPRSPGHLLAWAVHRVQPHHGAWRHPQLHHGRPNGGPNFARLQSHRHSLSVGPRWLHLYSPRLHQLLHRGRATHTVVVGQPPCAVPNSSHRITHLRSSRPSQAHTSR